ncbi:hypothetical protein CRG98_018931 [Punica granatum]|uniref:Uncharacterized protein n=1 Tax=Punica granatum TaxID=22663 RepID=A0A2I0JWJ2_PUNGR|nr:hypothetical protein CRG98_018931 [Punica granatum]
MAQEGQEKLSATSLGVRPRGSLDLPEPIRLERNGSPEGSQWYFAASLVEVGSGWVAVAGKRLSFRVNRPCIRAEVGLDAQLLMRGVERLWEGELKGLPKLGGGLRRANVKEESRKKLGARLIARSTSVVRLNDELSIYARSCLFLSPIRASAYYIACVGVLCALGKTVDSPTPAGDR